LLVDEANESREAEEVASVLARFEQTIRRFLTKANDRPSRVMEIAAALGAEIISGMRAPGSDLNSVELARAFQASRTPVREALAILEKEGLVEIYSRRRPRVAQLSVADIKELYGVRAAILALVASEAAHHATDEELDEMQRIAAEMHAAAEVEDCDACYWLNVHFHERLTDIARNATLQRILDTLVLRSLRMKRLALSVPERVRRSANDHVRLAETLRDRNADLAAAIARTNVSGAYQTVEAQLAKSGETGKRRKGGKARR
jgi:DNA-binding GntR family transcriptional regulator